MVRRHVELLRRFASVIDFLWVVVSAPAWFYIVLAGAVGISLQAGGLRSITAPSAWAMLGLFYVWLVASNSWHFVPKPDPTQFDRPEGLETAWRLWTVYLYETLILAYLAAAAITFGVMSWLVWGAYTGAVRMTLLTALYAFTNFMAGTGDVMQRYVCKANDPVMGFEYLYLAHGGAREGCGRLFVRMAEGLGFTGATAESIAGNAGPLFFPVLTISLMVVVLWVSRKKLRQNGPHAA